MPASPADRLLHPDPCATCGGERALWKCAECARCFETCAACAPDAPCGHAGWNLPTYAELARQGLLPQEEADAVARIILEIRMLCVLAGIGVLLFLDESDVGSDLYLDKAVLALIAVIVVPAGWPAWPRFFRDWRALATAALLAAAMVGITSLAATAGEGPGAHLRGLWRWFLAYGLMTSLATAYSFAPWRLPPAYVARVRAKIREEDEERGRPWGRKPEP